MRRHTQLAAAALYPPIGAVPNTVPDRAGSNDGTNNGAKVALVDGRSGLDFDGVNNWVETPLTDFEGQITIEARINPRAWYTSDRDHAHIYRAGNSWLIIRGSDGALWGRIDVGGSRVQSTGGVVSLNETSHVAMSYDEDALRLYINGLQVASTSASGPKDGSATPFGIGTDGSDPDAGFDGFISDLRIWNYARTQSEIQADMHKRLTGNEPGLVGYWPMQYGAHQ